MIQQQQLQSACAGISVTKLIQLTQQQTVQIFQTKDTVINQPRQNVLLPLSTLTHLPSPSAL